MFNMNQMNEELDEFIASEGYDMTYLYATLIYDYDNYLEITKDITREFAIKLTMISVYGVPYDERLKSLMKITYKCIMEAIYQFSNIDKNNYEKIQSTDPRIYKYGNRYYFNVLQDYPIYDELQESFEKSRVDFNNIRFLYGDTCMLETEENIIVMLENNIIFPEVVLDRTDKINDCIKKLDCSK